MKGKMLITKPSYAYIKIAEGCDNGCSFCLIPKLKGHYRSRKFGDIVDEARDLIGLGVKELNLVAQDCGLYGFDLYKKRRLAELLRALAGIHGDFWVRVLYIYPERIDDELLGAMASSPKICRYLDIPLQHGDPDILKSMGRPHDVEKTLGKIEYIRKALPCVTFRTSLIAGYPGETEMQFKNLLDFIGRIRFDHVGVFEYSREPGTRAFNIEEQVGEEVKMARRQKAMLLQRKISAECNRAAVGQTQKVLIEGYDERRKLWTGRIQRFAPEIDGAVFVSSKKRLKPNAFYTCKITKAEAYDLLGAIV
jgi:ribosomal protein S12 methylthiotransferase